MSDEYAAFLARKTQVGSRDGFKPIWLPDFLFDFQSHLVEWSLLQGRSAIFADCGLGKTPIQLTWAENVARHTNGRVLVMSPLAVSAQTVREGEKFGIECHRSQNGLAKSKITLTNYERLHMFDPNDFVGAVCDESGILKSFDGIRRKEITEFMRKMRYRLLCTATPSPNEYTELGTSSEALGALGYMDMLSRFFKNEQGNSIKPSVYRHANSTMDEAIKWRLKGHAELAFWRWICSWARACRKPSDIGFDDGAFVLPPLVERVHEVEAQSLPSGALFALPAHGLSEQREERRRTLVERCDRMAELACDATEPVAAWCHLNTEGDLLEQMIPGAIQVSGKDADEAKEEKFLAFVGGQARVLITKEKIGAWGLNFQHCARTLSFPTHSYEGYYQSVRRFWRFGQTRQVVSDIITTQGEKSVLINLQNKSAAADRMFANLVANMGEALHIDRSVIPSCPAGAPQWL